MSRPRVGFGYDTHQFAADKPLWLGGIKLEHAKGLKGHSDADVLIHAICDALLGAANMRDIGFHFSDKDPQWKGADSKKLLEKVCTMLREQGYAIGNIDATVCAEQPQINPHIQTMQETLAAIMKIAAKDISLKATTNEKMGYVGREEGINVYAVALILEEKGL